MQFHKSHLLNGSAVMILLASGASAQVFTSATTQIPQGNPNNNSSTESVAFQDVDHDGDFDAVFADGGDCCNDQNRIWINQGGAQGGTIGFFTDRTTTQFPAVLDDSRDIEFVDFDNDGDHDLYISNTSAISNQSNRWWTNMGGLQGGTLGAYTDQTLARWVNIAVNNGSTTFSSVPNALKIVAGGFVDWSCFCAFGDLDNDGDMDLFHSTYGGVFGGGVPSRVFRNDGLGNFEEFNPSGFQLTTTNISNGSPALWAQGMHQHNTTNATGSFADIADTPLGVELGDLDGDFDIDVLQGARNEVPRIYRNNLNGTGILTAFTDISFAAFQAGWAPGGGHYEQELGDMDNDGDLDIYGLNWNNLGDRYLKNNGDGTFGSPVALSGSGSDDNEPEWMDWNNDGSLDVFVANFSGQDRMYTNTGPGGGYGLTLASGVLPSDGTTSLAAAAGDVDNDGDQDIFVAEDFGGADRFLKNSTNTIDTHAPYISKLEQTGSRVASSSPTVIRALIYDNESFFITAQEDHQLEYSLNGGAFSSSTMMWAGGNVFRGTIPGTLVGDIEYRVTSTDRYGNGSTSNHRCYVAVTAGCHGSVTIYCTAKVNGLGCTPEVCYTGTPSASAGSGFNIQASNVLNNKFGLFFYSLAGQQAVPFQGGTLCVKLPIKRTAVQNSAGNSPPNDCSGSYDIDFNLYIAGGTDVNLISGVTVDGQYWGRDPIFSPPNNTSLTEGISFTICP